MFRLTAIIVGGLATTIATGVVASLMGPASLLAPSLNGNPVPATGMVEPLVANSVDRSHKGDRLAPPRQTNDGQTNDGSNNTKITVVEVIGIRDAAIVYRDRSGRELFRTDPMTNVTVVAKGSVLPQVTIRESDKTEVKQVPVETPRPPASPQTADGCEAVVSPFTAPSLSHLVGRCLAEAGTDSKYAAATR